VHVRDDLSADANGLVLGVVEGSGLGVDDLSVDLVRPAAVVPQASSGHRHIGSGQSQGLSVVERLDRRELGNVLLEEVGKLAEELPALGRLHFGPFAGGEGSPSGLDGDVDVTLSSLVYRADDLLVTGGRVRMGGGSSEAAWRGCTDAGLITSKVLPSTPLTNSPLMNL